MRLRGFTLGLASFADRLGRQEIAAELLDDVPGALWTRCTIEAARPHNAPSLIRVVVTIDLAATSTADADETEIIVAGKDGQGQAWCSPTRPAALRVIDPNVAFAAVRASRDKVTRADPVAVLYGQGRVHHLGAFSQLEDQMCSFVPSSHGNVALRSAARPGRRSGMALTDLLVTPMSNQGIFDLYRQLAQKSRS
jgi:phage terminase large subunit-like protein